MTKGKKWTLRLLGVAALALLICLCLMGSTMARYTSTGNGSGSLKVALWDLETEKVEWDASKLSPSKAAYDDENYGSNAARTNKSGDGVALVTLNNNSDVDALVTLSVGDDLDLTKKENFEWGTGFTEGGNTEANAYGASIMEGFETEDAFKTVLTQYGVITIEFTSIVLEGGTHNGTLSDDDLKSDITIDAGGSLTIYGDVLWTSVWEGATNAQSTDPYTYGFAEDSVATTDEWGAFSDAVDTILGMYYESIEFTLTWSAVQASVLPPE